MQKEDPNKTEQWSVSRNSLNSIDESIIAEIERYVAAIQAQAAALLKAKDKIITEISKIQRKTTPEAKKLLRKLEAERAENDVYMNILRNKLKNYKAEHGYMFDVDNNFKLQQIVRSEGLTFSLRYNDTSPAKKYVIYHGQTSDIDAKTSNKPSA